MAKTRTDLQRVIDDKLTEEYNKISDVQEFMAYIVNLLGTELDNKYGQTVRFFVKGGTALNILRLNLPMEQANLKWSDWDTNLIINPYLSIKEWYDTYREIDKFLDRFINYCQKVWEDSDLKRHSPNTYDYTDPQTNQTYRAKYDKDYQANAKQTRTNTCIHPLQVYDNATTLLQELPGMKPDDFAEIYYPFTALRAEKVDSKFSSRSANTLIADFYLYRMVIRHQIDDMNAHENPVTKAPDGTGRIVHSADSWIKVDNEQIILVDSHDRPINISINGTPFDITTPPSPPFRLELDTVSEKILLKNQNGQPFEVNGEPYYLKDKNNKDIVISVLNGTPKIATEVGLRAELLDVSIPRRDTEEAFNQWTNVKTQPVNFTVNNTTKPILVPDWEYHMTENILLVLEVVKGISNSAQKVAKRIVRGQEAIKELSANREYFDNLINFLPRGEYQQVLQNINNTYSQTLWKKFLLTWAVYNIEKDFNISRLGENNPVNDTFANLEGNVLRDRQKFDQTSVGTIVKNLNPPLTVEQSDFISLISFIDQLAVNIQTPVKTLIIKNYAGYLTNIMRYIDSEAPFSFIAAFDAVWSIIVQRGDWHDFNKSDFDRYLYPYIQVSYSSHPKINVFELLTKYAEIHPTPITITVPRNNNSIFIFKPKDILLPILFTPDESINESNINFFRGYIPIQKHKKIIENLNKRVAEVTSFHAIHWINDLRKVYQKHITSF